LWCFPEYPRTSAWAAGLAFERAKEKAITLVDEKARVNYNLCVHCGECTTVCPTGAMEVDKKGHAVFFAGKVGKHPPDRHTSWLSSLMKMR